MGLTNSVRLVVVEKRRAMNQPAAIHPPRIGMIIPNKNVFEMMPPPSSTMQEWRYAMVRLLRELTT
ncbi:hypothetical protein BC826DRAFT_1106816 [Russula brevipes]|nr:hypothetical protein BC826DRAFT_1106816 [Russula brevipes]